MMIRANEELSQKIKVLKEILRKSAPKLTEMGINLLITDLYEKNNSFVKSYENGNVTASSEEDRNVLEVHVQHSRTLRDILEPYYQQAKYEYHTVDQELEQ